jgi:hypothetical protein
MTIAIPVCHFWDRNFSLAIQTHKMGGQQVHGVPRYKGLPYVRNTYESMNRDVEGEDEDDCNMAQLNNNLYNNEITGT